MNRVLAPAIPKWAAFAGGWPSGDSHLLAKTLYFAARQPRDPAAPFPALRIQTFCSRRPPPCLAYEPFNFTIYLIHRLHRSVVRSARELLAFDLEKSLVCKPRVRNGGALDHRMN